MTVFIVYASVGAGHFKAAEALCNYLKKERLDLDVRLIDVLQKTNTLFRTGYAEGYSFLVNHAILLWGFAFWLTSLKALSSFIKQSVKFIDRLNAKNFINFLRQEDPDYIISTHFLPSQIAAHLVKRKKINSRIISIVTDFGVHPFWITEGVDTYIVPSGLTQEALIQEGIKAHNIKELGMPVEEKFLRKFDKNILCAKFGLAPVKFTVLIVTGSFGIGPIEEIVDLLYKDVQILAVCARNRNLYVRLRNKNYANVRVFGFVDNIEELMAVSSVIITKPGGLSISEILAMELFPIFISTIPGQEKANIEVLKKYNIGLSPKSIEELRNIILDFKENPRKLEILKKNIAYLRKPNALKEISDVIR
jgi:processive 1,2-diacylglycerol beta-glucosyltransferase